MSLKSKDEVIDVLISEKEIHDFVFENDLAISDLERHLSMFLAFSKELNICKNCKGIKKCTQDSPGYYPILKYINHKIYVNYVMCDSKKKLDAQSKNLLTSLHMPESILNASLEDYIMDGIERSNLYKYIQLFLKDYKRGEKVKGIYINGPFGTGKTYVLSALANALVKDNVGVTIVYFPDLVREILSLIKESAYEEKILFLKKVDILILDDVGAERVSAWFRDNVLGPIIQYRMNDNLPILYTSNYTLDDFQKSLCVKKSNDDSVKSMRIYDRIKSTVNMFRLSNRHR